MYVCISATFSQSIYLPMQGGVRGGVRVRLLVRVRARADAHVYTSIHFNATPCHQITAVMRLFDYRDDVNQE